MRYLLDTNIISELTRPVPRPGVLAGLAAHDGDLATTAITAGELRFGVELLPPGKRRETLEAHLEAVLTRLTVLPYDRSAALWHGTERARLRQTGKERPFADGQIAAIAVTRGLVLVTRNLADFEYFAGLVVEDWGA